MGLSNLDVIIFLAFFAVVVGVSMYKSRREETGEDFFLASRGLVWPLIGFSLIAANISTEHFVGMAGQGAGIAGMAIASYEWMADGTISLIVSIYIHTVFVTYVVPFDSVGLRLAGCAAFTDNKHRFFCTKCAGENKKDSY
jgi:uncharacterized sodium:solute symporter family permease YidK